MLTPLQPIKGLKWQDTCRLATTLAGAGPSILRIHAEGTEGAKKPLVRVLIIHQNGEERSRRAERLLTELLEEEDLTDVCDVDVHCRSWLLDETGAGIAPTFQNRIWDRFCQLDVPIQHRKGAKTPFPRAKGA